MTHKMTGSRSDTWALIPDILKYDQLSYRKTQVSSPSIKVNSTYHWVKEQRKATQRTFLNIKGAENPIGGQKGAHGSLSCELAPQPHLAYSGCSFITTKYNGLLSWDKIGPEATEQTSCISTLVSSPLYQFPAGFLDVSKGNNQVTLLLKDIPWLPTTQGMEFLLGHLHPGLPESASNVHL